MQVWNDVCIYWHTMCIISWQHNQVESDTTNYRFTQCCFQRGLWWVRKANHFIHIYLPIPAWPTIHDMRIKSITPQIFNMQRTCTHKKKKVCLESRYRPSMTYHCSWHETTLTPTSKSTIIITQSPFSLKIILYHFVNKILWILYFTM